MRTLSIVTPCCNEEDAIALMPERLFPVLRELSLRYDVELVLVDDGSTDRTWVMLNELKRMAPPCEIVLGRHPTNRGLGQALQTGVHLATGEIVVMLDADGTYPFPIIEPLVEAIAEGADVATASPYHRDGGVADVAAWRIFISRGASLLYRILVDRNIATYTAMVRAYRSEVIVDTNTNVPGYLYVAQILVEARRRGAVVSEVPAVLHQREVGVSKAKVVQITRNHLRYMAHLARLRLTGRFWLPATATTTANSKEDVRYAVK